MCLGLWHVWGQVQWYLAGYEPRILGVLQSSDQSHIHNFGQSSGYLGRGKTCFVFSQNLFYMYSVSCVCRCSIYLNSSGKQFSCKSKEDQPLSGTFSVVAPHFGNLITDVSPIMELSCNANFIHSIYCKLKLSFFLVLFVYSLNCRLLNKRKLMYLVHWISFYLKQSDILWPVINNNGCINSGGCLNDSLIFLSLTFKC